MFAASRFPISQQSSFIEPSAAPITSVNFSRRIQHLARIEYAGGIERCLQPPHPLQLGRRARIGKERLLPQPDAVLGRRRAAERAHPVVDVRVHIMLGQIVVRWLDADMDVGVGNVPEPQRASAGIARLAVVDEDL
jgi:hypothetical protein